MKLKPLLISMVVNTVLMIATFIFLNKNSNVGEAMFLAIPIISVVFSAISIYQANQNGKDNTKGWYFIWGALAAIPFTFIIGIVILIFSGIQC